MLRWAAEDGGTSRSRERVSGSDAAADGSPATADEEVSSFVQAIRCAGNKRAARHLRRRKRRVERRRLNRIVEDKLRRRLMRREWSSAPVLLPWTQ